MAANPTSANYTSIPGTAPGPDRGASFGSAVGAGLGGFFGNMVGQGFGERRLGKQLNPMRQAMLDAIGQEDPAMPFSPEQEMIRTAASDPRQFARLAGSQAGALALGQQFSKVRTRDVVIDHANALNEQFNLGIPEGATAKVTLQFGEAPGVVTGASIDTYKTAKETQGDKPFGASAQGRSLEYMTGLTDSFSKAELQPEDEEKYMTAITNLVQPEQYQDPDTGLLITRRYQLPDYVQAALKKRGYQVTPEGVMPPAARQRDPNDLAAQQASQQTQPTLGSNFITPPATDMPTLFEIAGSGKLTGVAPELGRMLDRMPVVGGGIAPEQTSLKTYTEGLLNRYVNALRMNPRYAEGEAKALRDKLVNLDPKAYDNAQNYQSRVIGFDDVLANIERESQEIVSGKRALVSGETRQHAMDTLAATQAARKTLLPPRMSTIEEATEYMRMHNPGDKFIVKDGDDRWVTFTVPPRSK